MPKTHRKKINAKRPFSNKNSRLVLVAQGDFVIPGREVHGEPKGRPTTGRVYTGEARGKPYPYGSARQGYGKAPRVVSRERPILTVNADTALSEA